MSIMLLMLLHFVPIGLGVNFSPETLAYELMPTSTQDSIISPMNGGQFCIPENSIYQGNLTFNLTLPSSDSLEHLLGETLAIVHILENEEGKNATKKQ